MLHNRHLNVLTGDYVGFIHSNCTAIFRYVNYHDKSNLRLQIPKTRSQHSHVKRCELTVHPWWYFVRYIYYYRLSTPRSETIRNKAWKQPIKGVAVLIFSLGHVPAAEQTKQRSCFQVPLRHCLFFDFLLNILWDILSIFTPISDQCTL